jgi:hypothetical protein
MRASGSLDIFFAQYRDHFLQKKNNNTHQTQIALGVGRCSVSYVAENSTQVMR